MLPGWRSIALDNGLTGLTGNTGLRERLVDQQSRSGVDFDAVSLVFASIVPDMKVKSEILAAPDA